MIGAFVGTEAKARLLAWQCTPHFLFGLAEKKTGRARSKRKERLRRTCAFAQVGLIRGSSEWVPPGEELPYRLAPNRSRPSALRRVCRSGGNLGVLDDTLVFSFRLRCPGIEPGSASGKRREQYPGLPRAKGFPKGKSFPSLTSIRNSQPSPAGGRRAAPAQTDPPRRFFLLDRPRPVLFLSRTKREWGVHCPGQRRVSPRRNAAPAQALLNIFSKSYWVIRTATGRPWGQ